MNYIALCSLLEGCVKRHELTCDQNMLRQSTRLEHYPDLAADSRLAVHVGEFKGP